MIVPVMAISNLVLTQQIYSEETNGAHAHYREPVPLIPWVTNYISYLGFLTCLSWIVLIKNSCTLSNVESLNLAQVQSFPTKYLLESFLMCSFMCSGFLKCLFVP